MNSHPLALREVLILKTDVIGEDQFFIQQSPFEVCNLLSNLVTPLIKMSFESV